MTGKWLAQETDDGAVVAPLNDAMDHLYDACPCGPTVEPVKRSDGSVGWVVTHHSLDGRECRAEGER